MGFDGIAVESHTKSETTDVTTASMELSYVLGQVRKAIDSLQLGALQEVTVRSEDLTVILRVLTREYFVALAINPAGNSGKGRYLLRVAAPRLQAEL
jgi:predicted regulator of Ras-like GTPase activity (Roadblock/LC7/MglB family)